jgi:hypothetical protein
MGAKPGAEVAIAAVEPSMASEPDGVLIAPGLLARAAHLFGRRGAASPIVRADFLNSGPLLERYGDLHRVIPGELLVKIWGGHHLRHRPAHPAR